MEGSGIEFGFEGLVLRSRGKARRRRLGITHLKARKKLLNSRLDSNHVRLDSNHVSQGLRRIQKEEARNTGSAEERSSNTSRNTEGMIIIIKNN